MKDTKRIITGMYESPCGTLMLGSFEERLCLCDWLREGHHEKIAARLKRILDAELVNGSSIIIDMAISQLDEYFSGQRQTFDIPLLFAGTEFQKTVWKQLLSLRFGETVSYGEIAQAISMPKAVRAVANANGANSISIFVPCHRVIGRDKSLTGYGGGLTAKDFLLNLEKLMPGKHPGK